MYPSGRWEGFWVQEYYGRQTMREFLLGFSSGNITGRGSDVIGRFNISGAYDIQTGHVLMVKQYIGKHMVRYVGDPDGEGCIQGTWSIGPDWSGPFLLRPVVPKASGNEPIAEIK
jgi:hypothetical protein